MISKIITVTTCLLLFQFIFLTELSPANQSNTISDDNEPPVVNNELKERYVTIGEAFEFNTLQNSFGDPDGDPLTLQARLSGDEELPGWLTFTDNSNGTGTFSGTPPGPDTLDITVTATDPDGLDASSSFELKISSSWDCEDYFIVVQEMPKLIGGLSTVQELLRYPAETLAAGHEGRVYVQFVVGRDGSILEPKVIQGTEEHADMEALRVLNEHAKFTPGYQNRKAECVQYSLPIVFKIYDNSTGTLQVNPIEDQVVQVNQAFDLFIPADTFKDPEMELGELAAYGAGYSELPDWITFNANSDGSGVLSGTPANKDTLTIELTPENLEAFLAFELQIGEEPVSVNGDPSQIPERVVLDQNYPNPFNPTTHISFQLPDAGPVTLNIYDLTGRRVQQILPGTVQSGRHTILFDGSLLPSGVYFYNLRTENQNLTRTMTLIK